jgi:CobW/HypB/UreG, nucleotide-binding domain
MPDASRPLIIPVGGFLGAGKTRLLLRAAQVLKERGIRSGIITNDQGENLVDTQWAKSVGVATEEVIGACFCCHFSELMESAKQLLQHEPAVIFIEPVGSCTDISATVLQPLKAYHHGQFRLAPYTVLVDPARASSMSGPEADPQLQYLFWQQLEEADLICWTKTDLTVPPPVLKHSSKDFTNVRRLSAKTGSGVDAWLAEVMGGSIEPGIRLLADIDYQIYAEAEAALGWLNWQAEITLDQPLSPSALAGPLFDGIVDRLTSENVPIMHLKLLDRCATGYIEAAVCGNHSDPEVAGDLTASPALQHELAVNIRAKCEPERLSAVAAEAFEQVAGTIVFGRQESFQPGAPRPEHRFKEPVKVA